MFYQKQTNLVVISEREDGYLVMNEGMPEDQWVIPKHVFDSTYVKLEQDFGWAIKQLKQGKKVARQGWNGKGMFIYMVEGQTIPYNNLRNQAKEVLATTPATDDNTVTINAHIDMRAADGSIVIGWLASQTDMLATDWTVVE